MKDFSIEEKELKEAILCARKIQEFLWSDMNAEAGLEEFKRMFYKRLVKLDSVNMANPHWKIELKKRLLQIAAISINMLGKLEDGSLNHSGIHPTLASNLPEFAETLKKY